MPKRVKGQAEVESRGKKLETLKIEYVGVDDISPNAYNPNRQSDHDFALLKASMAEDGFTQPVLVQQDTREIVDGEHRWRCARELGYEKIPVVFVPFTAEQMKISTLRHNRARGSEDMELVSAMLRDLRELGALDYAQEQLMMDDVELNALLEDASAPDLLAAEEFGEAWEPAGDIGTAVGENSRDGGNQVSMTAQAADRQREMEKRLSEARTREDREAARRDVNTYRVVAIFDGDEADIVRAVLGRNAAERIMELCREAHAAGNTVDDLIRADA
jgi:ParB-like chromosome segregation protein Spo0J